MDTITQLSGYTVVNIAVLTFVFWLVQTAKKFGLLNFLEKDHE